MASDRKVVLVTRHTRLEDLVTRFQTHAQARFYVEHLGADFADYEREHDCYRDAREVVEAALAGQSRLQILDRAFLPTYLFAPDDVVIALGQDGLVANTLKYLSGQPLLGINPEPARFDGVLLPFVPSDLRRVLHDVLKDRRAAKSVTMAKAALSDGQSLYAVNDLFIGPKTHVSARYEIIWGTRSEVQSSSGVIVSTGLGSTGWMRSIATGAREISAAFGGSDAALSYRPMPWDSSRLRFAVREPFPSVATQATLVCGLTDAETPLALRSLMSENGVIFSDGIEADFLSFNAGLTVTVSVADRVGQLVQ